MAAIWQSVPLGFHEAIADATRLPQDVLAHICYDVALYMQYRSGPVDTHSYTKILAASSASLAEVSLNSVVNAVTFLFKSAAKYKMDASELRSQLKSSDIFPAAIINTLTHQWGEQGKLIVSTTSQLEELNIGQLLDVQWKVGLAVSSDDCKSLHSPHVTLLLTVSGTGGEIRKHSVEMTVAQFRNFSKQLKEMAVLMETV